MIWEGEKVFSWRFAFGIFGATVLLGVLETAYASKAVHLWWEGPDTGKMRNLKLNAIR